jgi:hypothetical protein
MIDGEAREWFDGLVKYVANVVRRLPCTVEIQDEIFDRPTIKLGPGWTTDSQAFVEDVLAGFGDKYQEAPTLRSAQAEERLERKAIRWSELAEAAEKQLKWFGPREFSLPNGGTARTWIGYYELAGGASVFFLDDKGGILERMPDGKEILQAGSAARSSWRGFSVNHRLSNRSGTFVDVDFTGGREISVSRNSLSAPERDRDEDVIFEESCRLWAEFLSENAGSKYRVLNLHAAPIYDANLKIDDLCWKIVEPTGEVTWKEVEFPCVDLHGPSYFDDKSRRGATYCGRAVAAAGDLEHSLQGEDLLLSNVMGGGRLLICPGHLAGTEFPVLMWKTAAEMRPLDGTVGPMKVQFPPEWSDIMAVSTNFRVFLNAAHPAVAELPDDTKYRRVKTGLDALTDEIAAAEKCPTSAASFLVRSAANQGEYWAALSEKSPATLAKVFDLIGMPHANGINIWRAHGLFSQNLMVSVSPSTSGATPISILRESRDRSLTDVSDEWKVQVPNEGGKFK